MSRTIDEIMEVLGNNYTPEELVDILSVNSAELCECLESKIADRADYLDDLIREDLGEDIHDEDY